MSQHLFYLERAAEARATANAATLDNVRNRWLQSAESWAGMAARSERSLKAQTKLIADKAAERAAASNLQDTVVESIAGRRQGDPATATGRQIGPFALPTRWARGRVFYITSKEDRSARRQRQTEEFESNQKDLRASIAESKKLVGEADAMIRRHRDECDAGDGK